MENEISFVVRIRSNNFIHIRIEFIKGMVLIPTPDRRMFLKIFIVKRNKAIWRSISLDSFFLLGWCTPAVKDGLFFNVKFFWICALAKNYIIDRIILIDSWKWSIFFGKLTRFSYEKVFNEKHSFWLDDVRGGLFDLSCSFSSALTISWRIYLFRRRKTCCWKKEVS